MKLGHSKNKTEISKAKTNINVRVGLLLLRLASLTMNFQVTEFRSHMANTPISRSRGLGLKYRSGDHLLSITHFVVLLSLSK